ncbi:hypothetical protein [Pseudomonas sp. 6D_7.1_Bac1]|uniref:hypothetical protein n=1 Tax=Pseudomonas sp. 6D_7.1_Bac1 TaxID=2971615 RepID=UPI0021CA381D|nr:hypothetical protein [Pseudomonas sp. 6D_7.1_Bac1]MCU1753230.1 hypothetical protein [Pseudomonas sp. 6D_7.1_Bac1]
MPNQSLDVQYAATLELKGRFNSSLSDLLTEMQEHSLTHKTYNHALSSLSDLITAFEHYLTNASSDTIDISKTHTEDILASIENILFLCANSWVAFEAASEYFDTPITLPTGSYLFTSQAIFKTYKKQKAKEIESIYTTLNLPISGFNHKKSMRFNQMKIHIPQTIAGSALLSIGIFLAFFIGLETGTQYYISRILIALGAGFLITGLTKDYIKTKLNVNGTTITASGAIAIFLILYFSNPASAPAYTPDSQASQATQSAPPSVSPSEIGH